MSGEKSSKSSKADAQIQWLAAARRTAHRFNRAWFFERLALPLLLTGLVGAVGIMLARREWEQFPWPLFSALAAGILALVFLVAWLLARRRFTTPEKALVRLEDAMGMDNSLTAASHGIAPWPQPATITDDGATWNWRRLLLPPAATLLLLSAAFLLPISAKSNQDASPPEEPASRQSLQASLDELAENDTIDEDYIEEMKKKLEEMREQPAEEWFDHSSLEAADSLKKNHERDLKELERNMNKAERALNALQNHSQKMGSETRERLRDEFDNALQQMGQGAMRPNQELLEQLSQIDPNQLKDLSKEQLDQLRENMRQQAQNMQGANGGAGEPGGEAGDEWLDELMQEGGQGENGEGPGSGGVGRGPGTAPGVLGDKFDELKSGDMEGLQSRDLSNTLPGDLLQLQDGEHEIDQSQRGTQQGGEVQNLGEGGDLIWKIAPDLNPAEKKALREFFK